MNSLKKLLRDKKNSIYAESNIEKSNQILEEALRKVQLKEVEVTDMKMDLDKEEKNKNDISTSILTLQKEIADAEHMNKVLENLSVGFGAPPLPVLQERKDVLRTYKDSLIQSVEYIKQKYKKYQTEKSELKHLVAKYDNALKLNNLIKAGLLELEKTENDKILRQKRYIDDDIKQKYNMHQRIISKNQQLRNSHQLMKKIHCMIFLETLELKLKY